MLRVLARDRSPSVVLFARLILRLSFVPGLHDARVIFNGSLGLSVSKPALPCHSGNTSVSFQNGLAIQRRFGFRCSSDRLRMTEW